jgi:hypothetical protein
MKRYVLDCELLRGRRQRSGPIGRAGRRDSDRFVVDNTTFHAGKYTIGPINTSGSPIPLRSGDDGSPLDGDVRPQG